MMYYSPKNVEETLRLGARLREIGFGDYVRVDWNDYADIVEMLSDIGWWPAEGLTEGLSLRHPVSPTIWLYRHGLPMTCGSFHDNELFWLSGET